MNSRLNNERGYTLLLVLLLAVLLGAFATMLMFMTTNGMKKDDVREDVTQATELTEKGLDRVVEEIQFDLKKELGTDGLTVNAFSGRLESVLNAYRCNGGAKIFTDTGKTGKYSSCVETVSPGTDGNEISRIVTFLSKGTADNAERSIRSDMEVGANAVPEGLRYAIGTNKVCDKNGLNCDGGNLFLHGGVAITGDMKVDGNLITANSGYAYLGGERWIPSIYPSADPGPDATKSRLVLGGNVYILNKNPSSYAAHIASNSFTNSTYQAVNVSSAFSKSPLLIEREPKRETIDIIGQQKTYQFNEKDSTKTISDNVSGSTKYSTDKLYLSKALEMSGTNMFNQVSTDYSLKIVKGTTTIQKGLYVGGNLVIGNDSIQSNEYNASNYNKVELDGPIYVNGNLTIKGADAKLNSLIYVNGTVTIQNTRINGLNKNGKIGSLIVFANKEVKISNNSVNENTPSDIRGYFYSNSNFEMFGVGSNMKINGGISAKRIVLNAIRGRAQNKGFDGSYGVTNSDYFEGVAEQMKRDSRLQVVYNPEIINTYSDLKQKEPIIYKVDEPILKDRRK